MSAPQFEPLFTITAAISVSGVIPNGPQGTRVVVDASSGQFAGERLKGTVHGPGGDWVTARADGSMLIDVRLLLKTDDGADILMEYRGVGFDGGKRITASPLFSTGAEKYAWLNNVVAIAKGASNGTEVTYDVYEVK
ncbi:MAG: DUF3237 domain-containing protein [Ilumatobacteraceae bacterium]